jgi:uncharacterized protein YggT (Ycf19 family)
MGLSANLSLPLGDAITQVEMFVHVFIVLYGIALIAYILMSWVRLPYSLTLDRVQRFLHDVSEPYLRLFRRFLPMAGGLDFSPIVALLTLTAIDLLVTRILEHFQ